jgi:signal transduction histidine kinase
VADLARAVNRLAERLAAAERVRRDFFADVAHELRHPLTLILGRIEALQDGVVPLDLGAVAQLGDAAHALGRLVDDVRDVSLADVGQLHLAWGAVDLAALLDGVDDLFQPLARIHEVELGCSAPPTRAQIRADGGRLRQVLVNLVANALRFTPPGGRVDVRGAVESDGTVTVTVADTGPGISPEDLPHVFRRFYRADASRTRQTGGTGLGLAVADRLVRAHGGRLTVESVLGHGSTFIVTLPAPRT